MFFFRFYLICIRFLDRFTSGKNWRFRSVGLSLAVLFFCALPSYERFFCDGANDYLSFWQHLARQSAHPLTPHPGLTPASHEAKTAFRLIPPLTGMLLSHLAPMAGVYTMFAVQHGLGVAFLYLLLSVAYGLTRDRVSSLLVTLAFSLIYLTRAFFYELYGLFDGYAFFFMLLALTARRPYVFALFLSLAFWTDERAIVASPLIILFRLHSRAFPLTLSDISTQKREIGAYVLGLGFYGIMRWGLGAWTGLTVPVGNDADAGPRLILTNAGSLPLATFLVFEGTGLLVIWLIGYFFHRHARVEGIMTTITLAGIWCVSASVWDFTRSASYAFPVVLTAVYFLGKEIPAGNLRKGLFAVLILCAVIPTYKFHGFFYWQIPAPVKLANWFLART